MRSVALSELRSRARMRSALENTDFVTDTELDYYINSAINELRDILCANTTTDHFMETHTFNTTAGESLYDLPTGFVRLRGVDYNANASATSGSAGWEMAQRVERDRRVDRSQSTFLEMLGYHEWGDKIQIVPTPDTEIRVRLWYVPAQQELTDPTDTFDYVYNGWEEFVVVTAAISMVMKDMGDTTGLFMQREQLRERIVSMSSTRDDEGQTRRRDRSSMHFPGRGWIV